MVFIVKAKFFCNRSQGIVNKSPFTQGELALLSLLPILYLLIPRGTVTNFSFHRVMFTAVFVSIVIFDFIIRMISFA